MEKIRAADPDTICRSDRPQRPGRPADRSGRDQKYGAYDTVGKSTVRPADIRRLLEGGLEGYRNTVAPSRLAARDALSGNANPNVWDDRVTRAIGFKGDMGGSTTSSASCSASICRLSPGATATPRSWTRSGSLSTAATGAGPSLRP